MISSNTYLHFDGTCEAALKLYAEVLDARVLFMMRTKDSPMAKDCPPEMLDRVMHVTFAIGNERVMASDVPAAHYRKPTGFNINVNVDEAADAERIYAALAEGGEKTMAITETFWAKRFGTCVDRFGVPWMVNCAKPMA